MEDRADIKSHPIAIIEDRYGGAYSGGAWLAIRVAAEAMRGTTRTIWALHEGPSGSDIEAAEFWAKPPEWIATGRTPDEAFEKLRARG